MILEAGFIGFALAVGVGKYLKSLRDLEEDNYVSRKLAQVEASFTPSEEVAIALELLKLDDGWDKDKSVLTHRTGVRITRVFNSTYHPDPSYAVALRIADSDGVYQKIELNSREQRAINSELDAYNNRAKDRGRKKLRESLAERVLAYDAGTLPPLLGSGGLLDEQLALEDSRAVSGRVEPDIVPTRTLIYDHQKHQIIEVVSGARGAVGPGGIPTRLDNTLRMRYGLPPIGDD